MQSTIIAWALCLALAAGPSGVRAAGLGTGEPVPAKLALLVMLKVLTYDKNLAARGEGDFIVLVASEPHQEPARREVELAAEELRNAALRARPVRFAFAPLSEPGELRRAVTDRKASALLILRGASASAVSAAAKVAADTGVYTLSLDPLLVERALAVGVTNEDGRPKIVLNLAAAKQVNAAFEPAVLKLARIFQ